jgi:hypothetical protein
MRNITAMMAVVMFVMFGASFTFAADDVAIDNRNNNTNTNTNIANASSDANAVARQKQDQNQEQDQKQKQEMEQDAHSSAVVTSPRELLGLPTAPNLMPVTVIPEAKGCFPISAQLFTLTEINSMAAGSFWEKKGGWWHGLFSSRIKSSVRVPFEGKSHHAGPIATLEWKADIGFVLQNGDRKLGSFHCEGDYGYPLDASLGMCLKEAYEETNMTQVYACYTVRRDAHSSGTAYSGAGGASGITGEDGNVGASGAVAGTFGTSVAYANVAYDIELYAVQIAQRDQFTPPPPPVVKSKPPYCDTNEIWSRIKVLKSEIAKCHRFSFNNLTLRSQLGDAYIELYVCTGDKKYLREAANHYGIAEKNYVKGWDIKSHRKSAEEVIAQVYYNWGGCIWILEGQNSAMRFKAAKKLERIPMGFVRK